MTDPHLLTQKEIAGLTLWAEGRNQPYDGIIAVGNVLRNRMRNGRWGHDYRAVCLYNKQFSCWNDGTDENHVALMELVERLLKAQAIASQSVQECLYIGAGIVDHMLYRDITNGAMWYVTKQLYENDPPKWCEGVAPIVSIGDHVFFNQTK